MEEPAPVWPTLCASSVHACCPRLPPCSHHPGRCSKKYCLPAADVEAAEAVLAEASREPVLEGDSDDDEEADQEQGRGQASEAQQASMQAEAGGLAVLALKGPSSSVRSTVGSARVPSGGTTPACSSGCSSPRARSEGGSEGGVAGPTPAGPAGLSGTAAAQLAAARPAAVPRDASSEPAGPGSPPESTGLGSPLQGSSPSGSMSRRSSLERESKPSIRAVAANWRAWVAVRDAPCPGELRKQQQQQHRQGRLIGAPSCQAPCA